MSDKLKEEGLALFRRGLYDEALERFEEAAAAYEAAGNAVGQGEMLNNIGVIRRVENDWPAAQTAFERAETIFEKIGDENRRAQVMGNLGDLYAYRGEAEEAARSYSEASELMAQTEDYEKQADLLRALSLLRLRQRRVVESLMLMDQSLDVRPNPNFFQKAFHALIRFALRLMGGR